MGNCASGPTTNYRSAAITGGPGDGSTCLPPDHHRPNDAVDAFLKSRGDHVFSQIQLSLSATNLRDMDVFSKSDPVAVIYTKGNDDSLKELGRTEVIMNSLNPQWITKHTVTYHFERVQKLVFRVYDVDTKFDSPETLKLDEQQFLGEGSCTLSEIVTKRNKSLTIDLVDGVESARSTRLRNYGQLVVHAEELFESKTVTELIIRGVDIKNKDLFSKTDSFLVISKCVEGGAVPIYKTEVQKNNPSPIWKPILLKMSEVGSKDSPLTIECFNYRSNGNHDSLGKVQKSLTELEKLSFSAQGVHMLSPLAKDDQKKILKSQLFVNKFSETAHHTFLDYLSGGCELNFMVAIDFTSSNGDPRYPDSLHYIDPSGRLNAYQKAIVEVGEVLNFYDFDKKFPSWGFGARLSDGVLSHCFNLSGIPQVEVVGIEGIMAAYRQALYNVSLHGPTIFGPVITTAAKIAGESLAANEKKYFVLLIITDGVITDLQETKDALVKASDLPLSLLIVGVGDADFTEMEILDADEGKRLQSTTGRFASRDIVQFVPLRKLQGGEISVAQSLLEELPSQFLTYMRNQNILP